VFKFVLGFALAFLTLGSALSAEITTRSNARRGTVLAPERHVIELVQSRFGGDFVINGTQFLAKSPACRSWAAGEEIRLLAGDWHGRCDFAIFYNVPRRMTCALSCGGRILIAPYDTAEGD